VLEMRDRFSASDPGLGRLRGAVAVTVCVGSALLVQQAITHLAGITGVAAFSMTLFGAVVAMLGSNALVGMLRREMVPAAAGFPVAVAIGLTLAVLSDAHRGLQVLGFAAVLFAAVWVRRFGGAWFFYGLMTWIGFFFATFLQAEWAIVPELLLASVVSSGWVCLLASTVLYTNPRRVLHSSITSFFSRGRSVAREAADLLALPPTSERRRARAVRLLSARRAGMGEAALLVDAWSAERSAIPDGWSAAALRHRLIEAQQAMERVAVSAIRLGDADPLLRSEAQTATENVAGRRDVAALIACDRLGRRAAEVERDEGKGWWSARHLAYGVEEFLRFDAAADEPPEMDPDDADFEAVSVLAFGGLPGSPAVAKDVTAQGRWNPASRLSMTSRQAVQVALAGVVAVGLGTLVSPTHYYWAAITAFVMFTGTSTRYETFNKGLARVVGTVVGLVVAVLLAHITAGHDAAVLTLILVSVFGAFYLAKVSQAGMTFFITVLLAEVYTVLGTFSDAILVLRLGETAVGAVAGIGVALLFAPLSTRETVRSARDAMLTSMANLLESVATYADGAPNVDLDAQVRRLDDDARQLALVARPLTRQLGWGSTSPRTARRLHLYVAAVSQCRALAIAVQRRPPSAPTASAAAARAIAQAVFALRALPPGFAVPDAVEPLASGDHALFSDPAAASHTDPVVRCLHRLAGTLTQVAQTPSPASSAR
jgi:Fusaric acid resistance protein-like